MGANQSYEGEITHEAGKGGHNSIQQQKNSQSQQQQQTSRVGKHNKASGAGGKKQKAKPGPPSKPKASQVTSNSITLSWQPPRYNPAYTHGNTSTILAYTVEMTQFSTGRGKNNHGGHNGAKLHPGHWTVLTKACQATSYSARDLEADTSYAFRVRAENVNGVGKPSVPSEPITTHIFESASDSLGFSSPVENPQISFSPASPERSYRDCLPSPPSSSCSPSSPGSHESGGHRLRRRHSFNVHLDGGAVNKIANHSDVVVLASPESPSPGVSGNSQIPQSRSCHAALSPDSSMSSTSSSSTAFSLSSPSTMPSGFSPKHRYSDRRRGEGGGFAGREDGTVSGERIHRMYERANNSSHPSASLSSLYRKNSYNSSGGGRGAPAASFSQTPQSRKISLPILLPGTGTESLSRLRESRTSLRSSVSDVQSGQGHPRSGSREVLVVTVDRSSNGKSSGASSRRHSNDSLGSGGSNSANKDRCSRTSTGSGESEVTSSRMSLEDSASSSEVSRGVRTSVVSSASSGAVLSCSSGEGIPGGGRCGSYNSLSLRSSRSDVTLSNSKDGSKDSLCDLPSSNHSSVGDGNAEDVDSLHNRGLNGNLEECKNNNDDDYNFRYLNNNINGSGELVSQNLLKSENIETCDEIYKLKEQLKNFEITEENLRFHNLGHSLNCHNGHHTTKELNNGSVTENGSYYASLENPWEKDPSASGLSERILASPFCDDIKMALYARDLPENPTPGSIGNNSVPLSNNTNAVNGISRSSDALYGEGGDFRTLRSVLQSNNMFVKAQRFSPDVVGVVVGHEGDTCRTLTRSRLTTIADADEEEDPVRITAL